MYIKLKKSGTNMPVDAMFVNYKNNPKGKNRLILPSGDAISCDVNVDEQVADGYGYTPHLISCAERRR